MKILQKRTLIDGYAAFEEIFVRIGYESFGYDIKVKSMTLRGDLSEELERLIGMKAVEKLPTYYIIYSNFLITRHS